jgi:2-iminoacetate synthase
MEYKQLKPLGVSGVLVYQETYNRNSYRSFHPKGKKANFEYRLNTPDKIGNAGMYKIGLGCLLGLDDWRTDSFFAGLHLSYLEKKYWQTKFSVSFPRIRPAENAITSKVHLKDRDLIQLICAYRLFNEDIELSLSTRESRKFRDHAIKLGITSISAGSKTNPGGYSNGSASLKQFEISDERPPKEIAKMVVSQGYEPVWKDWDPILEQNA